MPRQLPWLNKGSGTRTQVKITSKAAGKRPRRDSNSDEDDFFDGTVLESSRKRKGQADPFDSSDNLPEQSTASTRKGGDRIDRALSSSPPLPESDMRPPKTEFMKKGVDRFNLRDDEWRMVEDEFLETAKLFSKHLYSAEYERLKKIIAEKKEKEVARPVISSASPSVEASFNRKAKAQAKAQNKAIDDVAKDDFVTPSRGSSMSSSSSFPARGILGSALLKTALKSPLLAKTIPGSDASDDDLDEPRHPPKIPRSKPASTSSNFVKPTLPSKTSSPSTPAFSRSRFTPFDVLDKTGPTKSTQPLQSSSSRFTGKPKRPGALDLLDEFDFAPRTTMSKEQTDRLAKRKADKEKEDKRKDEYEKKKSVKLDDIPTFLF